MSSASGWSLGFSTIAIAIAAVAYFHEPASAAGKPAVPAPAKAMADTTALDQRLREAQRQIDGLYETVARLEKAAKSGEAKSADAAAPAAIDDDKLKAMVQGAVREQLAQARPAGAPAVPVPGGAGRPFGGGFGAAPDVTAALKDQVGLDDDKAAKVKAILDESRASMRTIARDPQGGADKFRELRQQADDKVAAILTPAEMEKFKQWRGQAMQGMRRRSGAPAAGGATAPAPVTAPGANPL